MKASIAGLLATLPSYDPRTAKKRQRRLTKMTQNDAEYIQSILRTTFPTRSTMMLKRYMNTSTSVRDGSVKKCLQEILTGGDYLEKVRALALCANSKFFSQKHQHPATIAAAQQLFQTYQIYILDAAHMHDSSFNGQNPDGAIKDAEGFLEEFGKKHPAHEVFLVMLKAV